MVANKRKASTITLPTWGHRGTAGLVEEWESRVPLPEGTRYVRPAKKVSIPPPTESKQEGEEQKTP
jgi:hypothetical protein